MWKLRWILATLAILALALPAGAGDFYQTTMGGQIEGAYDMDPFPPPPGDQSLDSAAGYGYYGGFGANFQLDVSIPAPEEGAFAWYFQPSIDLYGLLLDEAGFLVTVDDYGVVIEAVREVILAKSWAELGIDWKPGLGIFLGVAATPTGLYPWDANWIVGDFTYDQDGDMEDDMYLGVRNETKDYYSAEGALLRSFTWLGGTGTAIPNDLADWLESHIDGVNAAILRDVDLSFLGIVDEALIEWGGPIEGWEAYFSAGFNFKLIALRDQTSTMETTWGQVKALF